MATNRSAALSAIAFSELGADMMTPETDDGYRVIVGSKPGHLILFEDYARHPDQLRTMLIKGKVVKSTAAGRYQILKRYADHYTRTLGLPDFGPVSQDRIALQLIRECNALADVDAGRIEQALLKCRSRWASLPEAGYGQHENRMTDLRAAWKRAGGLVLA